MTRELKKLKSSYWSWNNTLWFYLVLLIMSKYMYVVLHILEHLCHILIWHVWKYHVVYVIKFYFLNLNFKCTLMCRPLVLAWKKSSNKISRSQREQMWTGSTFLCQISNFDSKLHLKRRYFLLITKTLEFWSADSTRKWYCQSISDW